MLSFHHSIAENNDDLWDLNKWPINSIQLLHNDLNNETVL